MDHVDENAASRRGPSPSSTSYGTEVAMSVPGAPAPVQARPAGAGVGAPGAAPPAQPRRQETPIMTVEFLCVEEGKRFYGVRVHGQTIFVGTRGECSRFMTIHERKVAQDQAESRRVPRSRPIAIRTYRQARPSGPARLHA
jgi:hypothetical protein